jgi:Mg2+ and Co2+ transporter CorA
MKMSIQQVKELDRQPRNLAVAILTIVAAEWLTVKEYVTTRLTQIEWELEIPDFRGHGHLYGLDSSLKRLHPFRRILPVYRKWVIDVLKGILGSYHFSADEQKDRMLRQLRDDFLGILEEIEIVQAQVQNMVSVVTAIMSIEETKRSAEQNKNINRLTYLAVVFVPMSFISSLFSMTSDVASLHQTFWIFLALAIPLTLFALSIAQWSHIKVWCKKFSLLLSLN